ncbi:hypothetical protein D041_2284B, partial [Vibrio parahaemolyticus EKP-008]
PQGSSGRCFAHLCLHLNAPINDEMSLRLTCLVLLESDFYI